MDLIKYPEDMSIEEHSSLKNYIENGCPGLTKIDDNIVFTWFELYMAGKSYQEIAQITKSKKDLILYVSHKAKWNDKRMDYYSDIARNLTNKLQKVKLESANTIATAVSAIGKYYNEKFNKFITTNDSNIMESLDTKMLAQYYKSLEMLDKILSPPKEPDDGKKPTVNINVNSAKIDQIDDNTVDITPMDTEQAAGDLLKALAKFQRSKDSQNT